MDVNTREGLTMRVEAGREDFVLVVEVGGVAQMVGSPRDGTPAERLGWVRVGGMMVTQMSGLIVAFRDIARKMSSDRGNRGRKGGD